MKQKHIYLILAVVGFVVPYYFFVSYLTTGGADAGGFVRQLFANRVSTFFAADLIISSLVFVRYLRREAARHAIARWWLYLLALLTVGLSFALPLFLYVRESRIEAEARTDATA